jgi:glycosyltransferase involved in cell wall biosynthesis
LNKKVLFIAYYFPPCGGGGIQRPAKFVKYLRQFNWEAIVLTATSDSYVQTDSDILKDLPRDSVIERVRPLLSKRQTYAIRNKVGAYLPSDQTRRRTSAFGVLATWLRHWVMIPDSQIFWVIPAALRLRRILAKHKPDAIFATAPPFSVLLLGVLSKLIIKRPLVSDFRDPWSQYFGTLRIRESRFRKKVEGLIEKRVLIASDSVICPTKNMISYFSNEVDGQTSSKYALIYNGFDEEDFSDIMPKKFDKFAIVYTGTINSEYTSAVPFLRAVRELLANRPELKNQFEIQFVGIFEDIEAFALIGELDLQDCITIHGYLPHSECLSYQLGADLLLLCLNTGVPEPVTGKVFEYLRTRKPILAVVPEKSMAADLLRHAGVGLVTPPSQATRIAHELEQLLTCSPEQSALNFDLTNFSRASQTRELADLLDGLSQ